MRSILVIISALTLTTVYLINCSSPLPSIADEIEKVIEEHDVEMAIARYHELRKTSPKDYNFGVGELRGLGYRLFKSGKTREAILLAQLNAEVFPNSAIVYYDLAVAFHYSGNRLKSKQNIMKSLSLDSLSLHSLILKKRLFLVPDDFEIPTMLEGEDFKIRPLRVTDVDLDYKAVMSSIEHLQGVFGPGSKWPAASLTKKEDLKALQFHEEEFMRREAFTYTVMNPEETECLGCVYINYSKLDTHDAQVVMWVTADAHKRGLDPIIFNAVKRWIKNEWPFRKILYPGRDLEWSVYINLLSEQDKKYH
ncbi:MAG: hypothetical protein JSV33_13300 [bacterium]|nr:MAG: hypothetical protein JSV33_13300 [bacterium]